MEVLPVIIVAAGVLALACMIALFESLWRDLIKAIFRMIMSPVVVGEQSLRKFWGGIRDFFHGQFADKSGNLSLSVVFYHFIGACLYSSSFALFLFADFHLLCLTLAGMGIEAAHFEPPVGAGTLTAIAFIACVLFFGTLLLDLMGMTEIAPWRERLSENWSKIMHKVCLYCLLLSLLIAILCGFWRGKSLMEEEISTKAIDFQESAVSSGGITDLSMSHALGQIQTSPSYEKSSVDWIPVTVNVAMPILFLIGTALSGYGTIALIKFIMLATIFIFLSPTGLLLIVIAYTSRIIERIFEVVIVLIELLATIGRWIMGLFNYSPQHPDTQIKPPDPDVAEATMESGFDPYK